MKTRSKTRLVTAALALMLLAAPLLAQDGDAEDGDAEARLNEAYAAEVVDGKVEEAARAYLALIADPGTPDRIRAEARFRFAVCAVLLGRADEARSRLADLIADETVPQALRTRAKEYLAAADGIGVGTELEKRLEELTFELGRQTFGAGYEIPSVYRDFQIIGKPAVEHLKKLLSHPDAGLREHAYRVLLLMDVPGLGALWRPELTRATSTCHDLSAYLNRHAEELAGFEEQALSAEAKRVDWVLQQLYRKWLRFSADFLRGLAGREGLTGAAVCLQWQSLGAKPRSPELLLEWLRSSDEALATGAAKRLTDYYRNPEEGDRSGDAEVLRLVTDRLLGEELEWRRNPFRSQPYWGLGSLDASEVGYVALAAAQNAAELQGLQDRLVARGKAEEDPPRVNPILSGLADAVGTAITMRPVEEVDLDRFEANVKASIEAGREIAAEATVAGTSVRAPMDERVFVQLRWLFRHLPGESAEGLARWLFSGPGHIGNGYFGAIVVEEPRDVGPFVAALDAMDASQRMGLSSRLPLWKVTHNRGTPADPELAVAQADALPRILSLLPYPVRLVGNYADFALLLPAEKSRETLLALAREAGSLTERQAKSVTDALTSSSSWDQLVEFWRRDVLPIADPLWELLPEACRADVLGSLFSLLRRDLEAKGDLGAGREMFAAFLRDHYGELAVRANELARRPDLFPFEEWVGKLPAMNWSGGGFARWIREPEALAAARKMLADPGPKNDAEMAFLTAVLPTEEQAPLVDGLFRSGDDAKIFEGYRWIGMRTGAPASPEALEAALTHLAGEESPDLDKLGVLATILAARRPTEALFPAARKLLASGDATAVARGVAVAKNLGREDLLPDLVKLLDSLDASIRTNAKNAIDEIIALKELRQSYK